MLERGSMRKRVVVPGKWHGPEASGPTPEIDQIKRIVRERSIAAGIASAPRCAWARASIPIIEQVLDERMYYWLKLSHMAYLFNVESTYCSSFFVDISGRKFHEWLRLRRIRMAMNLLRDTGFLVAHIACLVGYADAGKLTGNFRKAVGMCPREFRQLSQDAASEKRSALLALDAASQEVAGGGTRK